MIPELGNFALILALCLSLTQAFAPTPFRIPSVIGQFIFLSMSMLCLIASFIMNDMTVLYVQQHSHALLPFIYRVGAAWGGHEGSLLLWCLILSGWTLVFLLYSRFRKTISPKELNLPLSVLGFVSFGFIAFLLFTSTPFQRVFPNAPITGEDLTPILQDPGLIFHPPMLYLGYVGFAIAFAFAISALIRGRFDQEWASACRPWVILPWSFLSCGIVLGSWWAYRELGWGGWWFWDPVENASLLPWLSATALIHSLIVTEKRNVFKGWTILLALVTFALSLVGTFLVRSGVLVSVHAFANDPTRGIFLLSYLGLIIGGSFFLYSLRIKKFYHAPNFQLFSRETFLLLNSVFLITAVITILIGTLYPIILDALDLEKISVGEPYFNTVFLPIVIPLLLLMGFAPHVSWGQQRFSGLWKKLRITLVLCLVGGMVGPMLFGYSFKILASVGVFLSLWIMITTVEYLLKLPNKFELKHAAMIISHLGIAVIAMGITINKSYSDERQIKMLPGETISLAGYQFIFDHLEKVIGSNYQSTTAIFNVQHSDKTYLISAEQRVYTSHEQNLSKPGILANPWRDLYLALGNAFPDGGWSVRIYYKPLVRWIWAGGFMLLLGGLLSIVNYLRRRT